MIDVKPSDNCDWSWAGLHGEGQCAQPEVWHCPAERISAILGPDGEPLRVPYERHAMGFDLRPALARTGSSQ